MFLCVHFEENGEKSAAKSRCIRRAFIFALAAENTSLHSVSASRDRERRRLIARRRAVRAARSFFLPRAVYSLSPHFSIWTLFFSSPRFSGRSRVIIGAAVCAMAAIGYDAIADTELRPSWWPTPVPLRVASLRYIDLFSSFSRTSFSASARRVFTVEWKFARQPNIFPSSLGSVRVSLSHSSSSSSSFYAFLSLYNVGQFHRVFIYIYTYIYIYIYIRVRPDI